MGGKPDEKTRKERAARNVLERGFIMLPITSGPPNYGIDPPKIQPSELIGLVIILEVET